jgi:hypothetical protein
MDTKLQRTLEKIVGKLTHDTASATYTFIFKDKEYRIAYDPIGDAYVVTEKIKPIDNRPHPCWIPPSQIDDRELKRIIELENR